MGSLSSVLSMLLITKPGLAAAVALLSLLNGLRVATCEEAAASASAVSGTSGDKKAESLAVRKFRALTEQKCKLRYGNPVGGDGEEKEKWWEDEYDEDEYEDRYLTMRGGRDRRRRRRRRERKRRSKDKTFTLRILHVNDHHSHLEADGVEISASQENLPPALSEKYDTIKFQHGGYPLLSAGMERFSDEKVLCDKGVDDVLKLHAGDAITGTIYYSIFKGAADADLMKSVCFDAFALGNHEFDDGDSSLASFLDALENSSYSASSRCPCPPAVLAANVVPGSASPLNGRLLRSAWYESKPRKRGKSLKVGIVGINVRQKTLESSQPSPGTTLLDERETAEAEVRYLRKKQHVDVVVLLTHVGVEVDLSELATIEGVDVVVGGDSHTYMGDTPPVSVSSPGKYGYAEEVTKPDGTKACVVQAFQYAVLFGVLDVRFDKKGGVVSCAGSPVVPFDPSSAIGAVVDANEESKEHPLSSDEQRSLVGFLEAEGSWIAVAPDMKAESVLDAYASELDESRNTVLANVPNDICLERIPGTTGQSTICDVCATASQGGGACNIVAKSFIEIIPSAEIALQNSGGCRTDISKGDFTVNDAFNLLPFSNTLVTMPATGQQVVDLLEDGIANFKDNGGSSGSYPYAYGIRYDVDVTAARGSRVTNVEVNPRVEGDNWTPIDLKGTYVLVTNSFVAGGRDGYFTFNDIDGKVDTFTEYAQAMISYAEKFGVIEDLPLSDYSTQSFNLEGTECQ